MAEITEEKKAVSVTYLTEGANPANSPVYYMTHTEPGGTRRSVVMKFRNNGVRGQLVTSDPAVQAYLDKHPHLTKEGLLSRHLTATLVQKDEPAVNTQTTGPTTNFPGAEIKRGR